ncbi:MAG: amidase [Balneolaceae bacterium]|nr:amidase [Balneolaceae bacterium]MDR9446113.1 amidase [Balneolaceae bacterium]
MSLRSFLFGLLIGAAIGIAFYFYKTSSTISSDLLGTTDDLLGLEFTQEERDQMREDVAEYPELFESLRGTTIANDIAPAFVFNPIPMGVQPPSRTESYPAVELPNTSVGDFTLSPEDSRLAFMSLNQLQTLMQRGRLTSVELTTYVLGRLTLYGETLEAVTQLLEERALAQAQQMDQERARGQIRGPLHGIPWGAKDLLSVENTRTTWGATPYQDQVINETATVVQKLDEAGAVLVAKLTLGALAYGDIWYGGKTRNPWDLEQGSSGSSAGSAASTSAGLVPFAIGTETLGSIVSPSVRTGSSGLRPTFGRVSRHGAMALSWTMDKIGPITRSMEDAALVFDAIHGVDLLDPSTFDAPFEYNRRSSLEGLTIGVPSTFMEESYSPESWRDSLFMQTVQIAQDAGATLVAFDFEHDVPLEGMFSLLTVEAAAAFDELTRSGEDDLMKWQEPQAWPNGFRAARFFPAVEWIQLNRIRSMLIQTIHKQIQDVDMILAPPFWDENLLITNLTGHPSVVLPHGFSPEGKPTGVTLIGHLFDEQRILEAGHVIEQELGINTQHPPIFTGGLSIQSSTP